MDFDIEIRQKGDVATMNLSGRLTLGEASNRLRDMVREITDRGCNSILMNLEKVSHIDSGGLGQLVCCYTTVTQRGGDLKLTGLSDRVADLLELTRLSAVFAVVEAGCDNLPRPTRHKETHATLTRAAKVDSQGQL